MSGKSGSVAESSGSVASLSCCLVLALGLLTAEASRAATYTIFGGNQRFWSGFALLRSLSGEGTVTGPASGSGSLMIPGGRFKATGMVFNFFPGAASVAQAVSTFTSSQTASHTFAGGAGPGSIQFCPPVGHPLNPNCNQAVGLAGYIGFTGYVDYDPGSIQYGGTFRVARKTVQVVSQRIGTNPSQFQHQKVIRGALPAQLGGPTTFRSPYFVPTPNAPPDTPLRRDWGPGLPTLSQYFDISPGPVTISPVLDPEGGFILTAGVPGTVPPLTPLPSTSTGLPFTTGRARNVGVNSVGGVMAFTVTGGNYRGPDGQGNIVLVAGGIIQNRGGFGNATYSVMQLGLVDTTLPEPLAGSGLAAGVVTLLVLVGIQGARRRRIP